jgi:hypothetical protein
MTVTIYCAVCEKPIQVCVSHVLRRSTCSLACRVTWQRQFESDPDELRVTVWSEPVTAIAESFGVSDKAIEKRCKRLGVVKPPRGYWAKMQSGISHENALLALGWKKEKIEKLDQVLAVAENSLREKMFQSKIEITFHHQNIRNTWINRKDAPEFQERL